MDGWAAIATVAFIVAFLVIVGVIAFWLIWSAQYSTSSKRAAR